MSCPGLHCPGCSGGQSLGILAAGIGLIVVAGETVQWVAARIWWIGGTLAVCFALAVAASMWLTALTGRREAAFAARRGILSRADVIEPGPGRPAIAPAVVNLNFYGMPADEQATIIRTAIERTEP